MNLSFTFTESSTPAGKLADVEVVFADGLLDGMKLVGFAIWERPVGRQRTVTFPARAYSVNGERRSFALLRPVAQQEDADRLRDSILAAYEAHIDAVDAAPAQA